MRNVHVCFLLGLTIICCSICCFAAKKHPGSAIAKSILKSDEHRSTKLLLAEGAKASSNATLPELIFLKEQYDDAAQAKQIDETAEKLANFISDTNPGCSIDMAIYQFRLTGNAQDKVVRALNSAANNNVKIRLAIFDDSNDSEPAHLNTNLMGDNGSASLLDKKIQIEGIRAGGNGEQSNTYPARHLMHCKYIAKCADTAGATLWTGSANFSNDAFGMQDNNMIIIQDRALVGVYEKDFQQMWESKTFAGAGRKLHQSLRIGDSEITVAFSPGDGIFIDQLLTAKIRGMEEVHLASIDMTSENVLKALSDKIAEGKLVTGVYDGPQMNIFEKAWARSKSEKIRTTLQLWNKVKVHLVAKQSRPYERGQLSNAMDNKIISDGKTVAVTGSFNFSSHSVHNAENVLIYRNAEIARKYADYVDDLVRTYDNKM